MEIEDMTDAEYREYLAKIYNWAAEGMAAIDAKAQKIESMNEEIAFAVENKLPVELDEETIRRNLASIDHKIKYHKDLEPDIVKVVEEVRAIDAQMKQAAAEESAKEASAEEASAAPEIQPEGKERG